MKSCFTKKYFLLVSSFFAMIGCSNILIANESVCQRTLQVKVELERLIQKSCVYVNSIDLGRLQNLDLSKKGIANLKSGDFDGLTSLTRLNLDQNSITILPSGLFNGLTSLRELFLNQNSITTLPVGVFDGLSKLQWLFLDENSITSLQPGVFRGLTYLDRLFLNNNLITNLPIGMFTELTSLSWLSLYKNSISKLQAGVFEGLYNIKTISIAKSQINLVEDGVFGSSCPYDVHINLFQNPISEFPDDKLPKARNLYQCPATPLSDYDPVLDAPFHLLMVRMDLATPIFTQVEDAVPILETAFIRDYLQNPITAHYGFNLIPTIDGTNASLMFVRRYAVEVCALVPDFCPIRQEIHAFPTLKHLAATTQLKLELLSSHANAATIAKVVELETALTQMFSKNLDYQKVRDQLPDGDLKTFLDRFFELSTWSFAELSEVSQKIQAELESNHDDAWKAKHFVPLFKIKSFLVFIFKKNFWAQPTTDLLNAKTLHSLVSLSESVALLTNREAQYLRGQIDSGVDFNSIIQKSINWQMKNLEREHFSQPNNPAYLPLQPQYQDPKVVLDPVFEKIVRTSVIAEWDRLNQ